MRLTLSVVCDAAAERPDGRVDLTGIFDRLSAPGFPAMQERMTAVFILEWDVDEAGRQALRADLIAPDDRKILTIEGHTDVASPPADGGRARTRLIMPIERVVFPIEGLYRFEIVAGGDAHAGCSIHVALQPADAARDPASGPRV